MPQALPIDDDQTLISLPTQPAASAGVASVDNALCPGTFLSEFEIVRVLGIGGFGIVYLATDTSLNREVALKEYMPASIAVRRDHLTVSILSDRQADTFQAGLRSFINEAKLLAQFDHPSLVKVHRFWEANGTAYMVMPFYQGNTLAATLRDMDGPPDEVWLLDFLAHILDALEVIHSKHCFHRDIAPDNILMPVENWPVLLDFGAARRVIEGLGDPLTVILKRSYAPIEQYGHVDKMKQGAWTDLYALASVVHLAVMGSLPQSAMERMLSDTHVPLAMAAEAAMPGRYSMRFLDAVDQALALMPEDRPQSVAAWRVLLGLDIAQSGKRHPGQGRTHALKQGDSDVAPSGTLKAVSGRSGRHFAIAGGVAVVALALWLALGGKPTGADGANAQHKPPNGASVAPSASQAQFGQPLHLAQPSSQRLEQHSTSTPQQAKPAFSLLQMSDEVVRHADINHDVEVSIEKQEVVIGKDSLRLKLRSSRPGYVYILMLDAKQTDLSMLFPDAHNQDNRIDANKEMALPRAGWTWPAGGPKGTYRFTVLVSATPRDFGIAGINRDGAFPLEMARQLYERHQGPAPLFAGTPKCVKSLPCDGGYGAVAFSIEEVSSN